MSKLKIFHLGVFVSAMTFLCSCSIVQPDIRTETRGVLKFNGLSIKNNEFSSFNRFRLLITGGADGSYSGDGVETSEDGKNSYFIPRNVKPGISYIYYTDKQGNLCMEKVTVI